ncbi:MAG TPA: hypothetical protein DCG75_02420 [Bacteroidales bacterium]|jgi:hypothetical protein|nr:hypothetical protein [Bacteroidales bacterium]
MKNLLKLRTIALLAMFLFLVFTVTSCMVLPAPGSGKPGRHGNKGKHKGFRKGKGNPHGQRNATPWESVENVKV